MSGRVVTWSGLRTASPPALLILALGAGSWPTSLAAQAQREERAIGGQRLCRYTAPRVVGPRRRERVMAVGRGEPCPSTFARPTVQAQAVPSLATLSGQERRGERVICRYAYGGRDYRVERFGGMCPLTPNLP